MEVNSMTVRFSKGGEKKRSKLDDIRWNIQHAISEIESGISSLEDATSELSVVENESENTAVKFLEELGLSHTKRYSLADVERLKIAVKWALEGE